jgi:hypothetical protein
MEEGARGVEAAGVKVQGKNLLTGIGQVAEW